MGKAQLRQSSSRLESQQGIDTNRRQSHHRQFQCECRLGSRLFLSDVPSQLLACATPELAQWLESVSVPHRNSRLLTARQWQTVNQVNGVLVILADNQIQLVVLQVVLLEAQVGNPVLDKFALFLANGVEYLGEVNSVVNCFNHLFASFVSRFHS